MIIAKACSAGGGKCDLTERKTRCITRESSTPTLADSLALNLHLDATFNSAMTLRGRTTPKEFYTGSFVVCLLHVDIFASVRSIVWCAGVSAICCCGPPPGHHHHRTTHLQWKSLYRGGSRRRHLSRRNHLATCSPQKGEATSIVAGPQPSPVTTTQSTRAPFYIYPAIPNPSSIS
jgi:hypothetical protein